MNRDTVASFSPQHVPWPRSPPPPPPPLPRRSCGPNELFADWANRRCRTCSLILIGVSSLVLAGFALARRRHLSLRAMNGRPPELVFAHRCSHRYLVGPCRERECVCVFVVLAFVCSVVSSGLDTPLVAPPRTRPLLIAPTPFKKNTRLID